MSFRDREKKRLQPLKPQLFDTRACEPGTYKGRVYDFCLRDDLFGENLHASIRNEAIEYFEARDIPWHDGKSSLRPKDRPSNHLCCSQSACVNFWFPFVSRPKTLKKILSTLAYNVEEVLPFSPDGHLSDGSQPYIAFEWIGAQNYLQELDRGVVAAHHKRRRGAGYTSLDFAIRFRQGDGRVHIVAGEWKYTECYGRGNDLRYSKSGTDRLDAVYRPQFAIPGCQIKSDAVIPEELCFDPFDQLMRQQLLASAMERESEMSADIVSLLHVAPRANTELMNSITAPTLERFGPDIHAIWQHLCLPDRFRGVAVEDLLDVVTECAPESDWAQYMRLRYGGMT